MYTKRNLNEGNEMAKKSLLLTVLLWMEIIVCLRLLFFVIPIWIDQYSSGMSGAMKMNDWFMVVLTITVFFHTMAAIFGLRNYLSGKLIRYLCLLVVFMMTIGLAILSSQAIGTIPALYIYPLFGSLFFVGTIHLAERKTGAL